MREQRDQGKQGRIGATTSYNLTSLQVHEFEARDKGQAIGACSLVPFVALFLAFLLFGFFEAAIDLSPVDNVPPRGQIVRAAVLVLEVIGMLPDIVAEDRIQSLR